jgi:hypothetical protein
MNFDSILDTLVGEVKSALRRAAGDMARAADDEITRILRDASQSAEDAITERLPNVPAREPRTPDAAAANETWRAEAPTNFRGEPVSVQPEKRYCAAAGRKMTLDEYETLRGRYRWPLPEWDELPRG